MFACAIDPKEARRFRQTSEDYDSDVCTMCGDLCAVRMDNFTDLGKGRAPADLRAMPMSKDREDLRRKKATIAAKKAQEGYFDDNGVWVAPEASGATAPARAPRGEKVLRDKK